MTVASLNQDTPGYCHVSSLESCLSRCTAAAVNSDGKSGFMDRLTGVGISFLIVAIKDIFHRRKSARRAEDQSASVA